MAYFEGPNMALWVAKINRKAYDPHTLLNPKATIASSMMNISATFITIMSRCLLKRSASTPAVEEKSRKGITKTAPEMAKIVLAYCAPKMAIRR